MHFGVRQAAAAVFAVALIFFCSCEKHHLGEDPEVQREHVEISTGSEENSSAAIEETSASPSATTSPTPAEFFPDSTPH
jgi:hypothetical protein